MVADVIALSTAWALTFLSGIDQHSDAPVMLLATAMTTFVGVSLLSLFGLYRARVCLVRAVEIRRLARASLVMGMAVWLVTSHVASQPEHARIIFGSGVAFLSVTLTRCVFASWLRARRMDGLYIRRIVVVGHNEEGLELEDLVNLHPELGFRVVAIAHSAAQVRPLLESHDANGVIIAVSALPQGELNSLIRDLLKAGVHVTLSNNLLGIDYHRLRPQPLAREPLFYLEQATVSTGTRVVKRAIDVAGSSIALLLSLPVLILVAVAVKAQDGGPILFRQQRIGRSGKPFTLYKFRSMITRAEDDRGKIQSLNQREGPIFKVDDDPRVTSVGRLIRAASIDELPQLVNVLCGKMSLVGPRPATPAEVEKFDDELLVRHSVRPGLTGLWQVEARENPSFQSYRRLDLFYIENLSLELDFLILLDTVTAVFTSVLRAIHSRGQPSNQGGGELGPKPVVPVLLPPRGELPTPPVFAAREGA